MSEEEFSDEQEGEPEGPGITIPPEWVPGVYANYAEVAYNKHEFTLDFIRIDPYSTQGVVVARVSMSLESAPTFADTLSKMVYAWANDVMSQEGEGNGGSSYGAAGSGPDSPA